MASGWTGAITTALDAAMATEPESTAVDQPEPTSPPPDATPEPPPAQPPDQAQQTPPDAESALFSQEQLARLKGEDAEVAKRLQADYTRKTMALAEERRALAEAKALTDALRADPDATIRQLAQQLGVNVADPQAAATVSNATLQKLEVLFGEHAGAVAEAVRELAKEEAAASTAPLQTALTEQQAKAMAAETDATLAEFTAKHPTWRQHERKMIEVGQLITPNKGMKTLDFMELCLREATKDISEAERVKAVTKELNNAAARREPPDSGVQTAKASKTVTGPVSIPQAIEDALAGIHYGE